MAVSYNIIICIFFDITDRNPGERGTADGVFEKSCDWPLLSPERVLQFFDSDLCPGNDILLNFGTMKLLYLQTQLTQL